MSERPDPVTTTRTRSWWGWGVDEGALTSAETDELMARIAALLPGTDLTDHLPPKPAP